MWSRTALDTRVNVDQAFETDVGIRGTRSLAAVEKRKSCSHGARVFWVNGLSSGRRDCVRGIFGLQDADCSRRHRFE